MHWRDEAPTHLFHYTEAEHAEAIAADGYFQVGPGANFGFGLYATDLSLDEATPEEVRAVCFEGDASDQSFNGVVVLEARNLQHHFTEVDRRIFLLPAPEGVGQLIPLERILAGVGKREGLRWRIRSWE
jgi:hypothetical protein